MTIGTREIWTEARRRLVERYMKEHPGVGLAKATDIVSDHHEEIGAEMDAIRRTLWLAQKDWSMSASVEDLAWFIRVHDVGEDAAQLSREYAKGEGSIGWKAALADAAAILRHFVVTPRSASGMSASGQDPQGLEAKPASPTAKPGRPTDRIR